MKCATFSLKSCLEESPVSQDTGAEVLLVHETTLILGILKDILTKSLGVVVGSLHLFYLDGL